MKLRDLPARRVSPLEERERAAAERANAKAVNAIAEQARARKPAPISEETRARLRASAKRAWADPERRARQAAVMKVRMADATIRDRLSDAVKRAWDADPTLRLRKSESSKRAWRARPDIQAQFRAHNAAGRKLAPETRARIGEGSRRTWTDPEVRARRIARASEALARPGEKARRSSKSRAFWARVRAALNAGARA